MQNLFSAHAPPSTQRSAHQPRTAQVTITTTPAKASKKSPSELRTRVCAFDQVANSAAACSVPKVIPQAVKGRIIELLRAQVTATTIVAVIAEEFGGYSVSVPSVTRLAPAAGVTLAPGPRPGSQHSKHRAEARRLAALEPKLTLQEIADRLGIKYQAVQQLLKD